VNWYLAELVVQLDVQDDPRRVVHLNLCLVEAGDAGEAYDKALALGRAAEQEYLNPAGRRVRLRFLGLRELTEIYEPLEDGAELTFEERIGISDLDARRLVSRRDELAVFRAFAPTTSPDYAAGEVMADVDDVLPPRVATIHHVTLPMAPGGEAEARRFYVERLQLTEIEPPPRQRERTGLWLVAGDRQLRLVPDGRPGARLALEVTKIDAWRTRLVAAGLVVADAEAPPGYRGVTVADPFGNLIDLLARGR
jgi:catechol 2,3-dioxygenase-like lactoylglutathione lyase family enzyme